MWGERNDASGKIEHAAISADFSQKLSFFSASLSNTLLLNGIPARQVGDA